jgi:hypothetical protein
VTARCGGVPVNSRGVAGKRSQARGVRGKKGGVPGKSTGPAVATMHSTPTLAQPPKGKAVTRNLRWTRTTVRLARDGLLGIDDGRGLRLKVAAGTVWLTQQNDRRDVVLRAGESFVIDRPGRTVVQALDRTELRLNAAAALPTSTYSRSLLKGVA